MDPIVTIQLSNVKQKHLSDMPWRDPHFMAYEIPSKWAMFDPLYTTNNKCLGHCSIPIFTYHILEPICPWFWRLNSPTKGLFQSNQRSFEVPGMGIPENSEPKKWRNMEDDLSFPRVHFQVPCLLDFSRKLTCLNCRCVSSSGSSLRPKTFSQQKKSLEHRLMEVHWNLKNRVFFAQKCWLVVWTGSASQTHPGLVCWSSHQCRAFWLTQFSLWTMRVSMYM